MVRICYAAPERICIKHEVNGSVSFADPWMWDEKLDKRYEYGECRTNPGNYLPDPDTYSPTERLDLLVKAGALIAAEIDRLKRKTP